MPVPRATLALCGIALIGFAANSLLARGALAAGAIDPAAYTLVRLASGALLLLLVTPLLEPARAAAAAGAAPAPAGAARRGTGAVALAAYAVAFSSSYVRIGAALGALVLFPTVKIALLANGHARGERPSRHEWLGAALALAGLIVLTAPGVHRPDLAGVLLMMAAGLAWALYTVAGQRVARPVAATRDNFAGAALLALPLLALALRDGQVTRAGLVLATISGAVTSALTYAVWYRVVPRLTAMQLGLAQLSVPVLAGVGAVTMLGEPLTGRLLGGGALVLGGVLLAMGTPRRAAAPLAHATRLPEPPSR
jgi:drug/metabolite transporter (DMT)-like permease